MSIPKGPHGIHVFPARPDAEPITWGPPQIGREDRPRTKATTCPCKAPRYYLIAGGGLMHIVRVDRRGQVETERMPHAAARALWDRLILGGAR